MIPATVIAATALFQVATAGGPNVDASALRRVASRDVRLHDGTAGDISVPAPPPADWGISIDGILDEPAWQRAPQLSGFVQYDPVEGIPASQDTDVRVLVTESSILFGIRAHDDDGAGIRATLARRDGFAGSDDWVRVVLDTFNDRRRAFVFQVNPLGVQADGLWVEGRGGRGDPIDWNPDFLWASSGRVDPEGYTVELEIPFKSLRFPESTVQDWGLQVSRVVQRSGFTASWAPITSDEANRLAQSGSLRGLSNLDPGLYLEMNPVLTASRQSVWSDDVEGLSRGTGTGDFGLNVTYGLTSNLTLDGTYNPDFSQVEADAGQITVNERFALFLPEKRPFFLEGTDVFGMPERLVYTRSVVNPVAAAKVSGKLGGTTVAYLGAVDQVSVGNDPVVNLVRLRRDVGRSSSLGMVYTDRTSPGQAFNRVAGADGRLVLGRRYTVNLTGAVSADGAAGGPTRWGSLFAADFRRSGRVLTLEASFRDISSEFEARSGFIRRTAITEASAGGGYTWRGGRGALVERVGVSFDVQGTWSRDDFWAGDAPEEWEVGLRLSGSLRGNVGGFLSYSREGYRVAGDRYSGLFVEAGGALSRFQPRPSLFEGLDALRFRSWISTWDRVRGSFGVSWSETPIFDRSGVPADLADGMNADVAVSLYPTGSLSMELAVRHARLARKRDGSTYSTATIPRVQARYQFSRSLFARAIGEYSSQEIGDILDPVTGGSLTYCFADECSRRAGRTAHDFRVESLIGYEPSPGTVLFVGFSRAMRDTLPFRFTDVQARSEGLFVKLSYRFRM